MGLFVKSEEIVEGWTVLEVGTGPPATPLTGMTTPGDIEIVLQRESASTMIAASETVTWTEVGVTGRYSIAFTPENTGLYVMYLRELHASSFQRTFEFRFRVATAGSDFSATYANAYCAETDLERWLQQAISATSEPSDTEAAGFAETRASILSSLCARLGYTVTPATITAGTHLEDLLRDANAIGASMDFLIAQETGRSPSESEKPGRLEGLWNTYVGIADERNPKTGLIEQEIKGNLAGLASDHIISGDTLAATTPATAPTNEDIGVTMGEYF
jgi:hypothetical protein